MTTTSTQPTRRRWFQFSLRTFLVATMLIGFGGAWVGMQLQQKRRHAAVVVEIFEIGGSGDVSLDIDVPEWKEWISGNYAVRPVELWFPYMSAPDSLLSRTQGMNLFALHLGSTKVTDTGLTHLKGFASLDFLDVSTSQVTDAGLTHLKRMASLIWIDLSDTQITDAGLTNLKELTRLEYLDLRNTQVTPAGVERLQKAIPDCEIDYSPYQTTSPLTPP